MSNADGDAGKAYNAAINYIAYRARSEAEVLSKLREKEYAENVIGGVIERLKQYDYINDEKFCEMYIHDKSKVSGFGRERIMEGLINLGVDYATAEKCLDEAGLDEEDAALKLLSKRYKNGLPFETDEYSDDFLKEKKKAVDFLLRKGYTPETAVEAFKRLLNEKSY